MNRKTSSILLVSLSALALAACGSSGGNSTPPPPPGPVTPPPPPPEPTFEERLADLAEHDPNPCRARTPGFEPLGGWLKNDRRELGTSRVWIGDQGAPDDSSTHGGRVWGTFTDCAVRSAEDQYARSRETTYVNPEGETVPITVSTVFERALEDGRDLIVSRSLAPPYDDIPLPEPDDADRQRFDRDFAYRNGDREDGQRILVIEAAGNGAGERTGHLQNWSFQVALERHETALQILVGGYSGDSDSPRLAGRNPATGEWGPAGTSICGAAEPLCLFGPWQGKDAAGTSHATPQVAAALDTVWSVWPDMDILDLRNLAFDCASNRTVEGVSGTERTYSYSNSRSFTSTTNSTWGHGILSLTCLFTPNGGLQNPVSGNAISGGIIGPIAGPVTGATITGVDYTGRDFGYRFARPVARENWALLATSRNLSAIQAFSGNRSVLHAATTVLGAGARGPAVAANLIVAGNAISLNTEWRMLGLTIRGGLAVQPEGAGSLTGSRAFRAPSTVSAAITAAYGRVLAHGFSMHLQADHWQTVATQGRSLWQYADLSESGISAALVKRIGRNELALQASWQSGIAGSLDVDGRSWPVAGVREKGVWLTWRHAR